MPKTGPPSPDPRSGQAAAGPAGADQRPTSASGRPGAGQGRSPKGSIGSVAAAVLRRAGGPLSLDALGAELPSAWDLRAGWRDRLRAALAQNVEICRVGTAIYDLVERRLCGARLRHVLTAAEVGCGLLLAEPDLEDILQWWKPWPGVSGEVDCVAAAGEVHRATLICLTGPQPAGRDFLIGPRDRIYRVLAGLAGWLDAAEARPGDEVCFCPEPPDARRFRLSLERGGANAAEVQPADALLADTVLAILKAANSVVAPHDLLRRLAGRMDLRVAPGVHIPIFVLGQDPRFAFDGTFYAPRAQAEAMDRRHIASSYPRPEDYPADWPERDPAEELVRQVEATVVPMSWGPAGPAAAAGIRRQVAALPPDVLQGLADERAVVWALLQDRSRLLNPPGPARGRPARGKVIRGPRPG